MNSKATKCSIFNLICHELYCALRRRNLKGDTALEILGHFTSARSRLLKKITTYSGVLLICAIAISNLSEGEGVDFSINGVGLVIPNPYIAFVGAAAFYGVVYLSLQAFVLISAQGQYEHGAMKKNRFIAAELSLTGDENSDILSPIRVGHFFRIDKKFTGVAIVLYLIPIVAALLPILAAAFLILKEALFGIAIESTIFAARSMSTASLSLIIFPMIYSVVFFIPAKIFKDKSTIRWNFLVHATRGDNRPHHNSTRWLKDEDK